jgi:Cytochrome P450
VVEYYTQLIPLTNERKNRCTPTEDSAHSSGTVVKANQEIINFGKAMVLLILVVAVLTLVTLAYVRQQWKYWAVARQLAGPKSYPFIGSAYKFVGVKNSEIVDILMDLIRRYPAPMKFWMGPKLFVITDDPQDIQILLNSPNAHSKGESYNLINLMMQLKAESIITSTGERWKHHRRLLNPCFAANILESYIPVFNRCSQTLAEIVGKEVNGERAFNIEQRIRACTFDMIADTSLGIHLECQQKGEVPFTKACDR